MNLTVGQSPDRNVQLWQEKTAARVEEIAGVVGHHLAGRELEEKVTLARVEPQTILPFCDRAGGQVLPADKAVLGRVIPGYAEPSPAIVTSCVEYAQRAENYGTAPGEGAAFITAVAAGLKPEAAFVFGTGRGRLEYLIAHANAVTEVVTIDLPSEVVGKAPGTPDKNNIRYRTKIGISSDEQIGDIVRSDAEIAARVHQILGDSLTFEPGKLAGTMGLVVIDGNHALPNALMDLGNALLLASKNGAVIVMDDFRKGSCLNAGVEAAGVVFSQMTGLAVLNPCPKPGETGLKADIGVIVVPAEFDTVAAANRVKELARSLAGA